MGFSLSDINPLDLDDGHLWDYVPLVSAARHVARGDSGAEVLGGLGVWAPAVAGATDIYHAVKPKVDAAYGQKAAGYDAIRAEVERLKQERKGQKDFAYNLANSKYQPTRDAIAAVYGDPKGWKL